MQAGQDDAATQVNDARSVAHFRSQDLLAGPDALDDSVDDDNRLYPTFVGPNLTGMKDQVRSATGHESSSGFVGTESGSPKRRAPLA